MDLITINECLTILCYMGKKKENLKNIFCKGVRYVSNSQCLLLSEGT